MQRNKLSVALHIFTIKCHVQSKISFDIYSYDFFLNKSTYILALYSRRKLRKEKALFAFALLLQN